MQSDKSALTFQAMVLPPSSVYIRGCASAWVKFVWKEKKSCEPRVIRIETTT
jgi:hypothetical protein